MYHLDPKFAFLSVAIKKFIFCNQLHGHLEMYKSLLVWLLTLVFDLDLCPRVIPFDDP